MKTRKKTKNSLKKKNKNPTQLKPFWKMDIAELCEYSEKWKKYDEDIKNNKNNKNNSHIKPKNLTQKNFKGIIKTEKKKTNKTFKLKKKYIRKTRKLITI